MPPGSPREQLTNRLADELGQSTAAALVGRFETSAIPLGEIVALLDELEAMSHKICRAAADALTDLDRRIGCSLVIPWLDVGIALAETSGATALKYFKNSPLILGVIPEVEQRRAMLAVALELAEQDANASWEYVKASPAIVTAVPAAQLRSWLEIGAGIAESDPVVGLEFIRQIPTVAPVVPWESLRDWLAFGMKLVTPNVVGKPDYLATMEFLRTSPSILADVEASLRAQVISLGNLLAGHDAAAGIAWLAEAPGTLRTLPSAWRLKMLQYGALIAERDAGAALSYLRRSPELIALLGDDSAGHGRFEQWFKAGMEVLSYAADGGRAYFAAETQTALFSAEQALSGVPLKHVARRIKLFVEALCGMEVAITANTESVGAPTARAKLSTDGKIIALPALLRRYPTPEQNERLYFIMAAHEAGHLEFGTYRLSIDRLADVTSAAGRRYGQSVPAQPETLADLFRLYPQPRLMEDLWTILEDARVEFLLQTSYPGLRSDLAQFAAETITARDPMHGLTVRELVVDCLLRLSTGASFSSVVPHALTKEISILWEVCERVLAPASTAEDAVRIADEVYHRLEQLVAAGSKTEGDQPTSPMTDRAGQGAFEADRYRAVDNVFYRGEMTADVVPGRMEQLPDAQKTVGGFPKGADSRTGDRTGELSPQAGESFDGSRSLLSIVDEVLAIDVEDQPISAGHGGLRVHRYPEWDFRLQDHRVNWCRVVERAAERGSDECVSSTLNSQRSAVRVLRRFFEGFRPPAFRRMAGQSDGEDMDVDAVVRRAAEHRAGLDGGDRIYVRHEKKERNVAVALLVDVSGSTGRQLDNGRRIIEVEKESLVLLCEALDAVGDQYALYAYSGQGRNTVEVQAIKEFDEPLGTTTAQRLGGLAPRQQNRDGAAIRHAVHQLKGREAKTRLLLILNDGRPLDADYKDEYALEDTKAALQAARRAGIHPFCVTIDREADRYVRRMYGDVEYTVIDRVESLPSKLPRIYQRLTT